MQAKRRFAYEVMVSSAARRLDDASGSSGKARGAIAIAVPSRVRSVLRQIGCDHIQKLGQDSVCQVEDGERGVHVLDRPQVRSQQGSERRGAHPAISISERAAERASSVSVSPASMRAISSMRWSGVSGATSVRVIPSAVDLAIRQ